MKILTNKDAELIDSRFERMTEEATAYYNDNEILKERLASLELALEDQDWMRLDSELDTEFSRGGLDKINQLARLYWLKNPLIRRAVAVQSLYVFGQGVEISSTNDIVNEAIQIFLDDPKNKVELTDHQNKIVKETELQLFGNLFFVLFTDKLTGLVKVRTIPMNEIKEIICDPEDSKTPFYYKRVYKKGDKEKKIYYRDWKSPNTPDIGDMSEGLIYHVSVNKLSDMKFGVSEVYSAIDWSKAYKEFLEDWATIVKAYSRFAWNLTAKNKTGVQRAKTKLGTTLSTTQQNTNPAAAAGSVFMNTEGTKLEPIKTSGATTSAEDGDKLVHMVSAATGIYYHYLVGDPSTGNLATAKSMERPMELMFRERQELWVNVYANIINFVIDANINAPKGALRGRKSKNIYGEITYELLGDDKRELNVVFPDILEKDTESRVNAIIKAASMDGKQFAGTIEPKTVARLLLTALGEHDVDDMLEQLFPDGQPIKNDNEVMNEALQRMSEFYKKTSEQLEKLN